MNRFPVNSDPSHSPEQLFYIIQYIIQKDAS